MILPTTIAHEEALKIFTDSGALLSGHFLLTSGRHSDRYMQCAQVLKYPEYTESLRAGWQRISQMTA
jgi:orotate phosphoribosyltransferase